MLWILIAFLCGSFPFSYWLGRIAGIDARQYGDGNPGATNVLKAKGWRWFLPAALLDGFKGAIPVGLANFVAHAEGLALILIAIAPILGHMFSPWLKFRGGKGIAVTFGVWAGLTLGAGPTILGLLLGVWSLVLTPSVWVVVTAMLSFGIFVVQQTGWSWTAFTWIWIINLLLLMWTFRAELKQPPVMRLRKVD